jgi:hypothetical protein
VSSVDPVVVRVLVVALCAAVSLNVALVTGILARLNDARPAGAVLTGIGMFAVWLPMSLGVAAALGGL